MTLRNMDPLSQPAVNAALLPEHRLQKWSGDVAPVSISHETIVVRSENSVNYRFHMKTVESSTETFGRWLRRQIIRRGWSPAEFARKIGVSGCTLSLWLNDKRIPLPRSIDKIADALALDFDYVLTKAGQRPPAFEVDPESYVGRLLAKIQHVEWDESRFESMDYDLDRFMELDERHRRERESSKKIRENTDG